MRVRNPIRGVSGNRGGCQGVGQEIGERGVLRVGVGVPGGALWVEDGHSAGVRRGRGGGVLPQGGGRGVVGLVPGKHGGLGVFRDS